MPLISASPYIRRLCARRQGFRLPEYAPILTFNDAVTFHMNGEEVRVFLALPAHTDGDSFVYFVDSDILHLGDVFRTNEYPIIDVYNGGSVSGMIEAMEIAIGLAGPNTKVIPGHGFGFTDRDGLIEVLTMLVDLRAKIREMIIDGMQFHEVVAANPTAEYDEKWGQVSSWNASDLVPIIYNEAGGGQLPAPPTSSETSGGCWLNTNSRRDHETKWVLSRQPQMEIRVELREGEPERHIGLGNLWKAITDQRAGERLPIDAPLTPRL